MSTTQLSAEWQRKIDDESMDYGDKHGREISGYYTTGTDLEIAYYDAAMIYVPQLVEAQERIKSLEDAMRLFIDNIDRWLETGIPATSEESKAIYDACKKALSPNNTKEDAGKKG